MSFVEILPAELVEEIFQRCLILSYPTYPSIDPYPILVPPDPREAPLSVSGVCSSWRRAAFSIPSLWTSLSIAIGTYGDVVPSLELIFRWLQRSSNHPLDLCLTSTSADGLTTQILDHLCQHMSRWRRFELAIPLAYFPVRHFLLYPISGEGAPLLERVAFESSPEHPESSIDLTGPASALSHLYKFAPRLRCIQWNCVGLFSDNVNWAKLTEVDLKSVVSCSQLLELLSSAHNICQLIAERLVESDVSKAPRSTLLSLHSLFLKSSSYKRFGDLLQKLTLPALRQVYIDAAANTPSQDPSITTLISRSRCNIQSLHLQNVEMTEDNFIALLHVCPTLVRLFVSHSKPILLDRAVSMLTRPTITPTQGDPPPYLCPNLKAIGWWYCVNTTDGLLSLMAQSRLPALSTRVCLDRAIAQTHNQDTAWFTQRKSEGHNVVLFYDSQLIPNHRMF